MDSKRQSISIREELNNLKKLREANKDSSNSFNSEERDKELKKETEKQ